MNEGFLLRVKYAKRGRLAYLSHLETIRSMERIIRRAQLPYAISEGFNPHMKVSFGPALPVGAASDCEYLDLRLKEYVAPGEALARMQERCVPDLGPLECFYIGLRDDAATVAFPVSVWEATFEDCDAAALQRAFDVLVERGYIEVARKAKKKRRGPAQIKQVLFEGRLVEDPVCRQDGANARVRFATCAQAEGSLRPDKFISVALEPLGADRPRMAELVRRALRPV